MKSCSATTRVYRRPGWLLTHAGFAMQTRVAVRAIRVRAALQRHGPRDRSLELDGRLLVQARPDEMEVVGRAQVAHGDLGLPRLRLRGEREPHPGTDARAELLHGRRRTATTTTSAAASGGWSHRRRTQREPLAADVESAAARVARACEHDLDEIAGIAIARRRCERDAARERVCAKLAGPDAARDDAGDPERRTGGEDEPGDDVGPGVLDPQLVLPSAERVEPDVGVRIRRRGRRRHRKQERQHGERGEHSRAPHARRVALGGLRRYPGAPEDSTAASAGSSTPRRSGTSFTPTNAIAQTRTATNVAATNAGCSASASASRAAGGSRCTDAPFPSSPRGRPWLTISPITATPSVAPIERAKCVSAVAEPIAARPTEFWTESTNTCIIAPIPIHATIMSRAASPFVVCTSIRESSSIPAASTTGPSTAFCR